MNGRNVFYRFFTFRLNLLQVGLVWICLFLFACTEDGSSSGGDTDTETVLPDSCEGVTELFPVEEMLIHPEHSCYAWVREVFPRAIKAGSSGSGAIVSLDTDQGTGLAMSAAHVLKTFEENDEGEIVETMVSPAERQGLRFVRLSREEGGTPADAYNATFIFYHPTISQDERADGFANILPRHDFFLAAVDAQLSDASETFDSFDSIGSDAPQLPTLENDTLPDFVVRDVRPDDLVMFIGYPAGGAYPNRLSAGVGRVLSEAEIETAQADLRDIGDEEGDLAYDAEAEMMLEAQALPGMSGGGVFDLGGRLVGVLVRGSTETDAPMHIVRAVRVPFIAGRIRETLENLEVEQQLAVKPFLDSSLIGD